MEEITNGNLDMLRDQINAALTTVGREHGLNIKLGSISYGKTFFKGKLEAQIKGAKTKEQSDYEFHAVYKGLPPLNSIRKFTDGNVYKLVGWKSSARKNKVKIQDQRNMKIYVCTPRFVEGCTEVS